MNGNPLGTEQQRMPRRANTHLTDRVIRALPVPASGSVITYDADVAGFGIRVTANDARSFVLNYVVHGRERRMTIGRFPTWSATAAREQAKSLRRKIDAGVDPLDEEAAQRQAAEAARTAPTVQDLYARYEAEHLPRKALRAADDDRSMWRKIVLPRLGSIRVADVSPADIDALHAAVSATRPIRANRVVEVVRKAFNLAIRWGWRTDNPASGVHRNHEEKRARYLSASEILKLSEALAAHKERTSASAIRFLMLTGARRGEVLGARWDMFDLEAGIWVKPSAHTKQRAEHRVPLSAPAVELLKQMRASGAGPHVFPSVGGKPLTNLKRTWLSICQKAGLAEQVPKRNRRGQVPLGDKGQPIMIWRPTARLHDLRHTYASILASEGLSLPIIGALLGHTQPQTTARYAHLLDDPLRAATERAAAVMTTGAELRTKGRDRE
jgi:integrase